MIHLNHATHAFFCTYLSKESAKQLALTLLSCQLAMGSSPMTIPSNYRTANKCMCAFLLSYSLS